MIVDKNCLSRLGDITRMASRLVGIEKSALFMMMMIRYLGCYCWYRRKAEEADRKSGSKATAKAPWQGEVKLDAAMAAARRRSENAFFLPSCELLDPLFHLFLGSSCGASGATCSGSRG